MIDPHPMPNRSGEGRRPGIAPAASKEDLALRKREKSSNFPLSARKLLKGHKRKKIK